MNRSRGTGIAARVGQTGRDSPAESGESTRKWWRKQAESRVLLGISLWRSQHLGFRGLRLTYRQSNIAALQRPLPKFCASKSLFSGENRVRHKKFAIHEKRGCGYWRVTVEPPSPAAQRCTAGRQTGRTEAGTRRFGVRGGKKKIRGNGAGRAKVRAHPVSFVSTLFEIDSI